MIFSLFVIICALIMDVGSVLSSDIAKLYNVSLDKNNFTNNIKKYELLLNAAAASIGASRDGALSQFDSTVGDGLCQVGAVDTLHAYCEGSRFESLLPTINACARVCSTLLSVRKTPLIKKGLKTSELICQYMQNNGSEGDLFADISLFPPQLQLSTLRYLLMDIKKNSDVVSGLAKTPAANFIKDMTKILNKRNIDCMGEGNFVSHTYSQVDKKVVDQKISSHGLTSCPTYPIFKVLLDVLKANNTPIIAKTRVFCDECDHSELFVQHSLVMAYAPRENEYSIVDNDIVMLQDPLRGCYVTAIISDQTEKKKGQHFYYETLKNADNVYKIDRHLDSIPLGHADCQKLQEVKRKLKNISIEKILLMEAAAHPQYHEKGREIDFDLLAHSVGEQAAAEYQQEIEINKRRAETEGFCLNNMSTAYTYHDYASTLRYELTPLFNDQKE